MSVWLYTLGSIAAISLVSLVGVLSLAWGEDRVEKATPYLVSLAAGGLLGSAMLHLIPRSVERMGTGLTVWLLVLAGFVLSFILESFLWVHHRRRHPNRPIRSDKDGNGENEVAPFTTMILIGDAVHNLIDGIVLAALFTVDPALGLITALAVLLHEVPQELGDFGALVHGGLSARRALLLNFATALTAVAGAVVALLVGARAGAMAEAVLPIAAGNFLYIGASDLVPELQREGDARTSVRQVAILALGIGLMLAVRLVRQALV